ncbi:MAG TPA: hypothetical protein VNZ64_25485 [Candidatus Acidoferrum sp.]|nr:hypothetical protein [Candidatus Acidoferrum sp.]
MNLGTVLGTGSALWSLALIWAVRNNDTTVTSVAPLIISQESSSPADSPSTANDPAPPLNQESAPTSEAATPLDPTPVLVALESESDPDRRSEALDLAAQSVAESDVSALLDGLLGVNSPAGAELRARLVRRWAESSPSAAAAWAAQLPEGPSYREAVSQVAVAWASTDLPDALSWATGLPKGEGKSAALLSLAYEMARSDPLAALELGGTLPPTPERDNLLVHAISQWAAADGRAAAAWAQAAPQALLRQRLVSAAAVALAAQDGEAAAGLACKALSPGEEQDRTVVAVAQRWALKSPTTAAAWVAQFPPTPARQAALQSLSALQAAQPPAP